MHINLFSRREECQPYCSIQMAKARQEVYAETFGFARFNGGVGMAGMAGA
jgi:hypothetical protein